ncbi:MAG: class II fructose-bisphosphate aldolase [Smithellaceae bacterium]|nr:class II fructose-bisphosphate aldolase [Smithellaceae bacterium]
MIYQSVEEMKQAWQGILGVAGNDVNVLSEEKLRSELIDRLIYTAVFGTDGEVKTLACWVIRRAAAALGIHSSSIQGLYEAMGLSAVSGFSVPAINIRALTYQTSQAIFRAAIKDQVGPVLFEIARSEIDYTRQSPLEYTVAVTAAAIKTGYRGPIFLQGDHFQVNAGRYAKDPEKELKAVKDLIWEAIEAGFYNIDIDTSTLVDLSKPTLAEQQFLNYSLAAELTTMIRDLEPPGITISVGGEIGEVGGKNSTVEELRAYMAGFLGEMEKAGESLKGISKISVQTGTSHGGVPMPDGSVAKVKLDFDTLQKLSEVAIAEYGLAGAVQHGASTLPNEAFDRFPATKTAEIHLATGFQNMIYDSPNLPASLRNEIYAFLKSQFPSEKKEGETEEQFIYKTRKKGFGPFKKELWNLPAENIAGLGKELENQFSFLFRKLNMPNTKVTMDRYITPNDVAIPAP